ncbi:5612_t:CDS:2, partial [Cetraspora pellucida]
KQLSEKTINNYYTSIEEMIRRVELGKHQYSNTTKAQMFINRLYSELYMVVSLLNPNILEDAYARTKKKKNIKERENTIRLDETEKILFQNTDMDNRNEIENLVNNIQEVISDFVKEKKNENKNDKDSKFQQKKNAKTR